MKGIVLENLEVQLKAKRILSEIEDAIDWLSTYSADYGITDEVAEELRLRLEKIGVLAKNIVAH